MIQISLHDAVNIPRIPKRKIERIARMVFENEGTSQATVNVVVIDDAAMHEMNKKFLNHDYTTDILTFCLETQPIDGEVYINFDAVRRQARDYKVSITNEFLRLTAHGVLHMLGYDDQSTEERLKMSALEDKYIRLSTNQNNL